jgi:hypothetical protein
VEPESGPLVCYVGLLPLPRLSFFFFFVGLGFELGALCLQNRHSTACAMPPVHFVVVILEMGSHKLFTQAGLEQ